MIELPREVLDRIKTSSDDLENARRQIALMKKIGMDTKALEEKLDWAVMVRQTLLEEFGD